MGIARSEHVKEGRSLTAVRQKECITKAEIVKAMNMVLQKDNRGKCFRFPCSKPKKRPELDPSHRTRVAVAAFLAYGLILVLTSYFIVSSSAKALKILESVSWSFFFITFSKVLLVVNLSVFVWRIVLVFIYRPAIPCRDEELPTCTVIVPAYNEGRQVLETIRSIARSDYPPRKMTIIGVDDGSVDDTWQWLRQASEEFPGRVLVHRQPVNRGKRRALYEGFTRGGGQVYVTIDSDSQVEPQTIRHLVSPLYHDPRVGAVAGNVRVLNREEGIIPKMLEVSFAYSFDFLRAGQSVVNSVLCTPGALSAYRREIVTEVLSQWLNQKFCGRPANIGEDRAMTNLILRSGYHVHYARNAVVYTKVPTSYRMLCRMFLRWARSNVRETLVMSRFAFHRFRETPATGARINLLMGWMNLTVGQILKIVTVVHVTWLPVVLGPQLLLATALASCAPGLFYALRYHSLSAVWAFPYGFFWLLGLSWIGAYAIVTPQKSSWLTRGSVVRPARPELIMNA